MPDLTDCPLCGLTPSRQPNGGDQTSITCPKCGTFEATGTADSVLRGRPLAERQRLAFLTRDAHEFGRMVVFNSGNIVDLVRAAPERGTPLDRLDRLLLFVWRRSTILGQEVPLDLNLDAPAVCATSQEELGKLFNAAADELKWFRHTRTLVGLRVVLTVDGMRRAIELQQKSPRSDQAFAAMSFDPALLPAYREGIEPALVECGYRAIRVDRVEHSGKIDDEIVAQIRSSSLMVADFTLQRTGVYFEAGFGLGLGIHVIWTCRGTDRDELDKHFDTRQYNHILWSDPADLKKRIVDRIRATGSIPRA